MYIDNYTVNKKISAAIFMHRMNCDFPRGASF